MRLKKLFGFLNRSFGRSANLAFIPCFFLLTVFAANGQKLPSYLPKDSAASGEKKQQSQQVRDTTPVQSRFGMTGLSQKRTDVIIPLSLHTLPPNLPSSLEQALTLSLPVPSAPLRANAEIISAWKSDLARQDEYRTLKTIAASIEMTGTAYLAYLSLKRYGLK